MRRTLIMIAGLGLLASPGLCCPVAAVAAATGIVASAVEGVIPTAYEVFWFPDAVSARLREVTADPLWESAELQKLVTARREAIDPRVHDGIKLLLGFCFAMMAGAMYWVSAAYEELYEKLFGKLSDFS